MKKVVIASAAVAAVMGLSLVAQDAQAGAKEGMEKCYGVVKAGHNDCGGKHNSCAGHAEKDGQADAWVMVPEGLCDKLVHGSTHAPE